MFPRFWLTTSVVYIDKYFLVVGRGAAAAYIIMGFDSATQFEILKAFKFDAYDHDMPSEFLFSLYHQ